MNPSFSWSSGCVDPTAGAVLVPTFRVGRSAAHAAEASGKRVPKASGLTIA